MHHFFAWKEYPVTFLVICFSPRKQKTEAEKQKQKGSQDLPRESVFSLHSWPVLSSTPTAVTEPRGTQLFFSFLLLYSQVGIFGLWPCLLWGHDWPLYFSLTPFRKGWVCTYTEVGYVMGSWVGNASSVEEKDEDKDTQMCLWGHFIGFPAGKCSQKLGKDFAWSPYKHFQSTVWN